MLRVSPESILKLHGIEWHYTTHHGNLALGYQLFVICYEPEFKTYVLKKQGEILFGHVEMAKCLDVAANVIFDYFAKQKEKTY